MKERGIGVAIVIAISLVVVVIIAVSVGSYYLLKGRGEQPGPGTAEDPYVITNATQLQEMKDNLTAYYILGNDIDASVTKTWNGGAGFEPIGNYSPQFTGSFDGQGHRIINLYINRPAMVYAGLFMYIGIGGVVENVGLEGADVIGDNRVGGLIGWNDGRVSNSYSTGTVSGDNKVGGLVGANRGKITNCYSTGSVSGDGEVGGLVGYGYNYGTVSNCYSTSSVNGNNKIGGLIGWNERAVTNCYSTGAVSGLSYVGGLIGVNYLDATVSNCYSTGSVSGSGSYVGGLVGWNWDGTVSNSYSTGTVSGDDEVGGLIGHNYTGYNRGAYSWRVINCYSTGAIVSAGGGGLIGYNYGTVSNSFWDIITSGKTTSAAGTGKTTENMKDNRTYTDNTWSVGLTTPWDFVGNPYNDNKNENIWNIHPEVNNGYPFLTAFNNS